MPESKPLLRRAQKDCLAGFAALILAGPAAAQTLPQALAAAYRSNPVLQMQRLDQQALDESYVQAQAGWRPTASGALAAQYARSPNTPGPGFTANNAASGVISASQPLYTGGRVAWAVRAADASVAAGRAGLRTTEAQVLLGVIQSYLDVRRDAQIVTIRRADLATLERQVAESSAKFDLGRVTRTDVAQAQAQLESVRASLAAALAQLEISRAQYAADVGEPAAGELAAPDDLSDLPASIDDAFSAADADNPALEQSRLTERASRATVAQARAAYRPTLALAGSYGAVGPISPLQTRDYGAEATAGLTLTVPLLTGGLNASHVRQAAAQNGADRASIEALRRQAIQSVAQAWNLLIAGRAGVSAGEAQVRAATTALAGAQAEYGFGLRQTLDVIILDESLRAAELSLAQSRHDAFLAQASVLAAVGRLDAAHLIPEAPRYDARHNFDRVKASGAPPWQAIVQAVDGAGG